MPRKESASLAAADSARHAGIAFTASRKGKQECLGNVLEQQVVSEQVVLKIVCVFERRKHRQRSNGVGRSEIPVASFTSVGNVGCNSPEVA